MKHYQGLLLDLDDTLYAYQPAHEAGMSGFLAACTRQASVSHEAAKEAFMTARQRVQIQLTGTAAAHNRLLYMQGVCELLNINPIRYALTFYNAYWDHFLEHMVLFPSVLDFLKAWRGLGRKICLITDLTAHIQYRKLAKLKLEDYFDCMVTSEEAGHDKPHPLIFLLALDKLQLTQSQVLAIGDGLQKDIDGARRLGIDALHFEPQSSAANAHPTTNFVKLLENLR